MSGSAGAADLYLDLMKRVLTRYGFDDGSMVADDRRVDAGTVLTREQVRELRESGRDWPWEAETMVGLQRLANVQHCVESVLADHVPGDLVETGVWRGGVVIFMRAILAAHGVSDRTVWAADSFQGLPPPQPEYPPDAASNFHHFPELAVDVATVRENFERYGLLDGQVRFLVGWFRDTLPTAPVDRIAVLRLDGDLYSSTWEAITALGPKVQPGGYVIVDDYFQIPPCRQAVDDYRRQHGIVDPIKRADWTACFWRKSGVASGE